MENIIITYCSHLGLVHDLGSILPNLAKGIIRLIYNITIAGDFPLMSVCGLFALTILIDFICNLSILFFKVVLIKKPFVM